jgi:ACS family sodium-dependent inorganic phosphate cotransporter
MENKPILSHQNPDSSNVLGASDSRTAAGKNSNVTQKITELSNAFKKRHVLALYSFAGFFLAYSFRANLSVAIVDMSKINMEQYTITHNDSNGTHFITVSFTLLVNRLVLNLQNIELFFKKTRGQWSPVLQGYILSAFFYGYIITQIPAGNKFKFQNNFKITKYLCLKAFLTTKYGGKFFFGFGVGACSLLSLLMPLAAYAGTFFIIVLRILQGLAQVIEKNPNSNVQILQLSYSFEMISQGFVFPSMHCMWSKWAPPNERSRLATFAFSGTHLGSVAALSVGGIIGERINWHSIFYIFGNSSFN